MTASDKQTECIAEIIRNVLRLPVGPRTKTLIDKHRKILEAVSDRRSDATTRLNIIQRHHGILVDVLTSVKRKLIPLLD